MKIGTRIASAVGTTAIAVAGIGFVSAGAANATTSYGIVENAWSGFCHGYMDGEKFDDGSYNILAQFQDSLGSYDPNECGGWIDQSGDGGRSWHGLIGYQHFGANGGNPIGWVNDSSTVIRVCVQSRADNTARCSGWW
ncbi:hypothetical protein ABH926_000968 [Catenulispora sp. GP43]|uniref:hypothetical protein n=1 Tax=Catenulispora sp. GP43 TaxID=3156263 RepID=UPI0035191F1E